MSNSHIIPLVSITPDTAGKENGKWEGDEVRGGGGGGGREREEEGNLRRRRGSEKGIEEEEVTAWTKTGDMHESLNTLPTQTSPHTS